MSQGVDLKTLLDRIKTEKHKTGRDIRCQIDASVVVRGDGERLGRVLGHLVQNALDATEENHGHVQVNVDAHDGKAMIEIEDSGCGMTEEFMRNNLFKPFQSTKKLGMGIGAYESYQYFKDLGGEVTVRSQVNLGTTIRIVLPLFQPTAAS
jgi:signal transduction histidine kinase